MLDWLFNASELGVDIETKDPNLIDKGPGVYRQDGFVCGVSFSDGVNAVYLDIQHPDTTEEQRAKNLEIIKKALATPSRKIGANIIYDLDWLVNSLNIQVNGALDDIQYAEPLLNEYRPSYSLQALSEIYGLEGKATKQLENFASGNIYNNIYKMPAAVVREYGRQDAILPVLIMRKQRELLKAQNLYQLYQLETSLIPLLLLMRKTGVRLNVRKLKEIARHTAKLQSALADEIYTWSGKKFNIGSTQQLATLLDKRGISYPRREPTALMRAKGQKGNPNLDKAALKDLAKKYPIVNKILDYRHYSTLLSTFITPYTDLLCGERLHCQFNPLRSDNYGTVSGRFSSSKPNLQQVPAMSEQAGAEESDEFTGQIIRSLFIPEEGCTWAKLDYSQVEYRIGAHYAMGPGSDELRLAYCTDPNTDFHKHIQDLTGFDRRTAKRLNFGASYGMGYKTAAKNFGWSLEEAEMFMIAYHKAAPFLKITRQRVVNKAETRGYIRTILGRRARINPERKLHSMYNRLIQGSAADIMKKALANSYQAGLFTVLKPHITVHDELDVSVPQTKEGQEALKELKYIFEHCVKLSVPLIVECHTAANWAEAD